MKKTWTIIDIVRTGTDFLEKNKIESPRLNVELLLCKVMNLTRLDIYIKFDKPLSEDELSELRGLIDRRRHGEPLQYLLGSQQFINLNLTTDSRALIPRPETEILAELAGNYIKNSGIASPNILDIGTGTGALAIFLAKMFPEANVVGLDVSPDAISLATENAKREQTTNLTFHQADILKVQPKKIYDLVVSNPPYISTEDYNNLAVELKHEPRIALCDEGDGLGFYRRYADVFPSIVGESFFVECGAGQATEISAMFEKKFIVEIHRDYAGIERIVSGCKK